MKLVFKKNEMNDVEVTMFKGTLGIPFSYIEMIKSLMTGESLDRDFDKSITEDEKNQIEEVLKEIETIACARDDEPEQQENDETDF